MCNDLRRGLNKLDQHPFPTQRIVAVALRVYKSHVVTGGTLPDAARSEAHSLLRQPFHRLRKRMYPQPEMVEGRSLHPAHHGESCRVVANDKSREHQTPREKSRGSGS